MLGEIAAKGGSVEVFEDHYSPWDAEAELLGLINRESNGGGFGFTETLSLTNKGRQHLGTGVVTPPVQITAKSAVTRFLRRLTRPILAR
ncbi:hypothetical protein AMC90_CH02049 [Rhizobium phaseoli]|nr:hypothetical protein AMC90_CH02049 [Rhizobium phaseoli]ANL72098.1 hypothetical protein AMC83_CH02124 [Rhizobium phaseoli]RDJ10944.1 hypothetical protein B5K04_12310 [Rhizobium phaseoli]RDJ15030.1 hypothetical protein B5K05_12335 [Rhizobium phaseoli]